MNVVEIGGGDGATESVRLLEAYAYGPTTIALAPTSSWQLQMLAASTGCPVLLVEEQGTGPDHPFSGEKLSVVLAVYRYQGDITAAADLVNAITGYQGLGHTCGIHTSSDANVERLAMTTKTARVLVNQNLNEGAGSPRNGLPFTLSLSCGTWGGNITTENVNARHFVNLTWVSRPIEPKVISEEALFAGHWQAYGR
jgi:sulfoacetaldehyde dehydrogenase